MEEHILWEQLARYFAGELSGEEHRKMKTWIRSDPEREQQMRKLHKIWKETGNPPYKLDVDEAWKTLSGNMDKLDVSTHTLATAGQEAAPVDTVLDGGRSLQRAKRTARKDRSLRQPGSRIRRLAMSVAAAATVLIAGLFAYHYNFESKQKTQDVAIRELVAHQGERATYVLNDGTRVVLHAGSRLEVPLRFNEESRELFLEGEAWFEVAHDATKPFLVHSEHAYTRVLGTKFLVQAWPDASGKVEVVVSEGKVALGANRLPGSNGKEEAIITQNQKGALTGDKGLVVTSNVDMDWYLGWTRGRLVFDNRPFSEIIPQLERWYAVEIQTADKRIGAKKLTAEIDYSQPMDEVLKGIALSLDLEFEKQDRTITFHVKKTTG